MRTLRSRFNALIVVLFVHGVCAYAGGDSQGKAPEPIRFNAGLSPKGVPLSQPPGAVPGGGVTNPSAAGAIPRLPLSEVGRVPASESRPEGVNPLTPGDAPLSPTFSAGSEESGKPSEVPGARKDLDQIGEKVVPLSAKDAGAGAQGFKDAFDHAGQLPATAEGGERKTPVIHIHHDHERATLEFHEHSHVEREAAPTAIPPRLEPYIPSDREKHPANWNGIVNLHVHSVDSDGVLKPEELVQRLYDDGVRVFALTDHDTTAGVRRALEKAKELGMEGHPGEEMTARGGVHIGAIDFDIENKQLIAHNAMVSAARLKRAEVIIKHLNSLPELKDKPITIDEVIAHSEFRDGGTLELPHIARVLVDRGLIRNVAEAFNKYLKGKIIDAPDVPPDPTVEDVLAVIRAAGGFAIFNHPYTVHGRTDAEKDANVVAVLRKGFDAIEVYRANHPTSERGKRQVDERAAHYLDLIDQNPGLVAAAGSDFHGAGTGLNEVVSPMPGVLQPALVARLKRPADARSIESFEADVKTAEWNKKVVRGIAKDLNGPFGVSPEHTDIGILLPLPLLALAVPELHQILLGLTVLAAALGLGVLGIKFAGKLAVLVVDRPSPRRSGPSI